jgi:hypothetical protein
MGPVDIHLHEDPAGTVHLEQPCKRCPPFLYHHHDSPALDIQKDHMQDLAGILEGVRADSFDQRHVDMLGRGADRVAENMKQVERGVPRVGSPIIARYA